MWRVLKAINTQTDIEQFQNFWKKQLKCAWQIKELSLNDHGSSSYLVHSNFSQLELCPSVTGKKQQHVLLIQLNSLVNASVARYTYLPHRRQDQTTLPRRPSHCCSERTPMLSFSERIVTGSTPGSTLGQGLMPKGLYMCSQFSWSHSYDFKV